MNTPVTSWIRLMLDQAQRCHHLAWFLYGCAAREQVLNLNAFAAWWGRGAARSHADRQGHERELA